MISLKKMTGLKFSKAVYLNPGEASRTGGKVYERAGGKSGGLKRG
jgi:hypothetical protein